MSSNPGDAEAVWRGGEGRPADVTILTLLDAYLPGYKAGGPIRSVRNLAEALGKEFGFRIVTLDRDHGSASPDSGVAVGEWVRVDQAEVMYLRPGIGGLLRLCAVLHRADKNTVLYLNSFFSRRFSMLAIAMWRLGLCRPRRVVLAPRGEFSEGALKLKPMRKWLYLRVCRALGLYGGLIWHASSRFEAMDIRRQFPRVREAAGNACNEGTENRMAGGTDSGGEVLVAEDLAQAPSSRSANSKRPGSLRIVFVSRISRKKNLSGALKMLKDLRGDVRFDICGPVDDADYWRECQDLMAALPANIRIKYWGPIEHERVAEVFASHDVFLFPTWGENYGHVIFEALAAGCPVVISNQTPWRNLEAEGVGWDIPLEDTERFKAVLQRCVDGDEAWHGELSRRAMRYAARRAGHPEIVEANRRLFLRALESNTPRKLTEHV